ncbi:hypothetical protein SARC_14242, partial [Sphaeroforma arctica JP610]
SRIEDKKIFMSDVRYCVIDEADTLFDEGFHVLTEKMITPILRARNAADHAKTVSQMQFVGQKKVPTTPAIKLMARPRMLCWLCVLACICNG